MRFSLMKIKPDGLEFLEKEKEQADPIFVRNMGMEGDYSGKNLRWADLRRRNLCFSSFKDADLENANLTYADLTSCDLRGAILVGAILVGAELQGTKLEGAIISADQICYIPYRYKSGKRYLRSQEIFKTA